MFPEAVGEHNAIAAKSLFKWNSWTYVWVFLAELNTKFMFSNIFWLYEGWNFFDFKKSGNYVIVILAGIILIFGDEDIWLFCLFRDAIDSSLLDFGFNFYESEAFYSLGFYFWKDSFFYTRYFAGMFFDF